jgi:hypothetical protein
VGVDLPDLVDQPLDPVVFRVQAYALCQARDFAGPVGVRVGHEHQSGRQQDHGPQRALGRDPGQQAVAVPARLAPGRE